MLIALTNIDGWLVEIVQNKGLKRAQQIQTKKDSTQKLTIKSKLSKEEEEDEDEKKSEDNKNRV